MTALRLRMFLALPLLAACASKSDPTSNGDDTTPSASDMTLSGTIVGLQGTGTVLTVNGASDIALPPNQPTFQWTLKKGTNYAIAVKAQPSSPTQLCTLTNSSGTLSANTSTATLTCVTQSFGIRGTISGLTGTGLTLALSGGTPIAIAAGATTFEFPALRSGTQFAITVASQPTGQQCVVNNGNGTIAGGDVTAASVTCISSGLTVGGRAISLSATGLTLRLNAGEPLALTPPPGGGALDWTFPTALSANSNYVIVVSSPATSPLSTCLLRNAKGRVTTANATSTTVQCFLKPARSNLEGTYAIAINGLKSYLTLWADGTYTFVDHSNDPSCSNNGNGVEYGGYKRFQNDSLSIFNAFQDTDGNCGIWDATVTPSGLQARILRVGGALTVLSLPDNITFTLNAVSSNPATLVGAFSRADGTDGGVIVFEADGTFMFAEAQDSPSTGGTASIERGCYTVSGSSFTVSFAAACRPDGAPALDLNGTAGFSARNGAAIPFTINSATTITIDGVLYRRLEPNG
ncbi:MAG: hypothetical protein IPP90_02260 [Gemmatimonadaceae bacterium]|nr:hypothetical protein [Gemmatimonadaceae bacterium]